MDALAAIGLIGNILTFIDYGHKTVRIASTIYHSARGASAENEGLETTTARLRTLAAKIEIGGLAPGNDAFRSLVDCAATCRSLCDDLLALLDTLRARRVRSWRAALVQTVKGMWRHREKEDLLAAIKRAQEQLNLATSVVTRSVSSDNPD